MKRITAETFARAYTATNRELRREMADEALQDYPDKSERKREDQRERARR